VVESNSMGEPIIEQLRRDRLPIQAFTTTNSTKGKIIEDLSLGIGNEFKILNDPILIEELESYESERLPSGMIRYNAPSSLHDDCVMSLAMAYSASKSSHKPMGLKQYLESRGK